MVATRGRTFKRPWRRSCLSSKLKSSSAPIGRKDSWCFHAVGSSNAPLLGSTAAEGLPRIGRTSIATRWRSCGLPQSASCSENFVIPPDVFGQTLRSSPPKVFEAIGRHLGVPHCVLNVLVPEVVLQGPRVVAIVGELEPASMAKHVRVDREWHLGGLADALDEAMETDRADWSAALGNEHVGVFGVVAS